MKFWPNLFFKKENGKKCLIFILERGRISGGIFDKEKNNFTVSSFLELLPFEKEDKEKNQPFFSAALFALEHLILEIRKSKEKIPAEAHIFLPQALYAVQIAHLTKEEEKPFLISKEKIAEMIQADRAKRSVHLFKEEEGAPSPAATIEERLYSVRLNGYETNNPYGKKARQVSLTSVYSLSPKSVLEKINELLERSLGKLSVFYHPGAVSLSAAYFHTARERQNFAFLWPMRDETEVTLVHNGRLGFVGVIPYGFETALGQTARIRGTSEKETLDALLTGGPSLQKEMEPAYASFREAFTKTLVSASPETYLPRHFVFPGGRPASSLFAGWLGRSDFWQLSDRFRSLLKTSNGKELPSVYISSLSSSDDILILAGNFVKETHEI